MRPTNDPTRGAWGWTIGEQTYLRVRPSKTDPIVAKVPHATKMFVWGKYNGWYRVETVDHKFGWVYHDFLKCPKARKIAPLTHTKAVTASNRASSQLLYGSKNTLQTYYARHHASGAVRGLAKQGVRLASLSPASKKAAAAKASATRRAQLASLNAAKKSKPVARLAAKPSAITGARRTVNPNVRLASVSTDSVAQSRSPERELPRLASGAHFGVRPRTHDYSPQVLAPRGDLSDRFPEPQNSPIPAAENAAPGQASPSQAVAPAAAAKPAVSVPVVQKSKPKPVIRRAPVRAVAVRAPRVAPRPAPQAVVRVVAPAPRVTSPAVLAAARQPVAPVAAPLVVVAPHAATPVASAPLAVATAAPAAVAVPVAKVAAKAPAKVLAKASVQMTAAQKRARARQQRHAWILKQRQERRNQRLASRGNSLNRLRARMGAGSTVRKGLPPLSPTQTRPISPEELMRARDSHLASTPGTTKVLADAPTSSQGTSGDFIGSSSNTGGFGNSPTGRDLSPRSDAGAEIGGPRFSTVAYEPDADASEEEESGDAQFVLAAYTSRERSTTRYSDVPQGSRWAVPQDGPSTSAVVEAARPQAEAPAVAASPAPTRLASRAGSPRDRMWAARAASPKPKAVKPKAVKPKAGFKPNVIASRGGAVAARGPRGGSPRDYYAAQRRASGAAFGQTLASGALSYRGTPYRSGGTSPRGFDCSGLVYFLLRQRGITPPRTAAGLASFGRPVSKKDLQAGDIVLFSNTYKRGISHVGIYQGEGKFVHAPHTGARVRTDVLFSGYYNAKYWGARRPK